MQDIMQRDSFKHAEVIAGKKGLHRQVNWTHILETNQFESLINGKELILTTGADLNLDMKTGKKYIITLIEKDAAGICIELGTHVHYIDQAIIEIANRAQFPIIIFKQFVKFVEITQDIHAFIINKHH